MKKYFLTVVYAIDDKPETVEAILAQRPWQAVALTDALADLEHAQADLQAATDGYNAARLEIESLQARVQEHVRSGKDWAMRVEVLERTIDKLREENAALQQRDDDWHKEHSNALVEIARLKVSKADARHDIDDLTARDESQRLRIAELEAQLYAIGAGGVEPLRKTDTAAQAAWVAGLDEGRAQRDHLRGATEMVTAARQPLDDKAISQGRTEGYDAEDPPEGWAFAQGVRFAERAHGITGEPQ